MGKARETQVAPGHRATSDTMQERAGRSGSLAGGRKRNSFEFEVPFLGPEKVASIIKPALTVGLQLIREQGSPYVEGSINRLSGWFSRMAKGNKADVRTPIYLHLPREEVLRGYDHVMEKNAASYTEGFTPDFPAVFKEVEEAQRANVGPQSMYLPWTLDGPNKLMAVMSDKPPKQGLNSDAYRKALQDVASLLPPGKIKRLSVEEAIKGMGGNPTYALDTSTNAGFPSWVRGWGQQPAPGDSNNARGQALDGIRRRCNSVLEYVDSHNGLLNLTWIGTASQRLVQKGPHPLTVEKGKPLKAKRIVIAMPKDETILGKTIMAPMQAALAQVRNKDSGVRLIPAWASKATLDKNMQMLLQFAEDHGRIVLSGDISSFDATLPPWVMWDCFKAISTWMDTKTAQLFLSICKADVYGTGVIHPSGFIPPRPSSVKSGSIFTSLIGCMANYLIQRYGMHAGYYRISQQCVMGDDFLIDGDGVIPESISQAFADFGMECNPSKQFVYRGCCHFLQMLHVLGLPGGMGSIYRIGGNVLSLEDDTQMRADERNEYAYDFQALARLENGCYNPVFAEWVDFVAAGDRNRLHASLNPDEISKRAGTYAKRKLEEGRVKPWTATSGGIPFRFWAVNRVLRGEKIPPVGVKRFEWYNHRRYSEVPS